VDFKGLVECLCDPFLKHREVLKGEFASNPIWENQPNDQCNSSDGRFLDIPKLKCWGHDQRSCPQQQTSYQLPEKPKYRYL
jgi:hypothetical protein